jgi:hypothetical protein
MTTNTETAASATEAQNAPVEFKFADLSPLLLLLAGNPLVAPNEGEEKSH